MYPVLKSTCYVSPHARSSVMLLLNFRGGLNFTFRVILSVKFESIWVAVKVTQASCHDVGRSILRLKSQTMVRTIYCCHG